MEWRTASGKQPAVVPSFDGYKGVVELIECFHKGHKIVYGPSDFPTLLGMESKPDGSEIVVKDTFLLDFAGDDAAIIVAHWSSAYMDDDAYQNATNRAFKLTVEVRESRNNASKASSKPMVAEFRDEMVKSLSNFWNNTGTIVEVDSPKIDVDFSADGPHPTPGFREDLRKVLNCHSKDSETGLPDFVLAGLVAAQIESLAEAIKTSEEWKNS